MESSVDPRIIKEQQLRHTSHQKQHIFEQQKTLGAITGIDKTLSKIIKEDSNNIEFVTTLSDTARL